MASARAWGVSPDQIVDFSANLNPLGPPPEVLEIVRASVGSVRHYPEPYARGVRRSLSQWLNVPESCLAVTAGASEGLERVTHLLASAGEAGQHPQCIIPQPAYAGYERAAIAVSGAITHVSTDTISSGVLESLVSEPGGQPSIIYIGNPNNPTGRLYCREDLVALGQAAATLGAWILVDEAFVHFLEPPGTSDPTWSVADVAAEGRAGNLLVIGSLTKIFAFPGLRVGYVIAPPDFIDRFDRHRDPWTVGALAQHGTTAALAIPGFVDRTQRWLQSDLPLLQAGLQTLPGVHILCRPTANFILFEVRGTGLTAADLAGQLASYRIIIRDASSFPGLDPFHVRTAVRTMGDNALLLEAMAEITHGAWGDRR